MEFTWIIHFSFIFISASQIIRDKTIRIIGGQNAYESQFTFSAAINVQTSNSKFFCGGTLLSTEWVLTSGHCVYNAVQFLIQCGSLTLTSDDPQRLQVSSSEYVIHPQFNPDSIENDIGLIHLRIPITLTDYIQPAFLATKELDDNVNVIVLGWGQTNDNGSELSESLKYARVVALSNAECRITYGNYITDKMVCVQGNSNEGTCNGDTGGALVEPMGRFFWIVGVASFISGNGCESVDPSGYIRTFPYRQWVMDTINSTTFV